MRCDVRDCGFHVSDIAGTDERGSVIGIANDAGAITKINKYDVYGAPDATNQGRFQYTGQVWMSELNLYHYKARAYHPRLGRFMQTDPIGVAGGINLYGYVGNDPVNASDSTGLEEDEIETVTVEGCRLCLEDPVELPRRRDGGGGGGGDGGGGGGGGNADGRGNEGTTPAQEKEPEQKQSKLKSCIATQYGFGSNDGPTVGDAAKIASEVGSLPVYKPLVGMPVLGTQASRVSNVVGASVFGLGRAGLKVNPVVTGPIAAFIRETLGTVRAGTAVGRANVYLGIALLHGDAESIASCASSDDGEYGGGGGAFNGGGATGRY